MLQCKCIAQIITLALYLKIVPLLIIQDSALRNSCYFM